jgi:hypothetical protein
MKIKSASLLLGILLGACASSPSQAGWTATTFAQEVPLGNGDLSPDWSRI